jgi:hypothetical protein
MSSNEGISAMPNESVKPIRELISLARQQPAKTLPLETHQSYPIPVPRPDGLRVAFLFCTQVARPGSIRLVAPGHLAFIHAVTGKFEQVKKVRPRDFGQAHPEGEFIGEHTIEPGMTYEGYLAQQETLYRDYDVLLPAFAAGATQAGSDVKAAAVDFKVHFERLAEKPLLPYYRAIGRDFFAWLDRLSAE